VHLATYWTGNLRNPAFDRCVNVFFAINELKCSIEKLCGHLMQGSFNLCDFGKRQYSSVPETFHVRKRASDVVFPQTLIKRQTFGERQQLFGRTAAKPSMPQWL
jgi:hypothetical protein